MQSTPTHFDVIIIGGGPSGASCALALKNSGLRVALIDKAKFPRDKICGDAIPGRARIALQQIDSRYAEELGHFGKKTTITSTRFVASEKNNCTLHWENFAYNCRRIDFDQLLFNWAKRDTTTTVFENTEVKDVEVQNDKVIVRTSSQIFSASVIVGCEGGQSIVAKKLANFLVDRNHYCGAVRAYFKNVSGTKENVTEVFFPKKFLPGYFWIFPLDENTCNVGFGMLSKNISERKLNLTQALQQIIEETPELKQRFANAEMTGNVEGFGLPLGSRKVQLSGDRFLLCGDAASLIDPFSGDGIGNAIVSARLAAVHITRSFSENKSDALFNKQYDEAIYGKLWKELHLNTRRVRLLSKNPWLLNLSVRLMNEKNPLSKIFRKMI